ncbi:DUF2087 domain-containing protein [Nocardioides sp. B-3]|uniref:DUF2087 domain-containing protein n=1 Tax=Nocardioides sp. B-3 TaxID=2895565 RepID=UPI002152FB96|nr:DUF2087 domain-containing protein [Nocardioides sp. B-3]UUZ61008.1 DUF2087 domain-containing protein [Nocardioides sp. B-3]
MAETGESYTVAGAAIEAQDSSAYAAVRTEQERLVARLFTAGRLARIPAKRKVRAAALLEVLTRFEPGRDYSEPEVNEVLLGVHEDFAYLRRELVNYRLLGSADGVYRVVATAPTRAAIERRGDPGVGGDVAAGIPRGKRTRSVCMRREGCSNSNGTPTGSSRTTPRRPASSSMDPGAEALQAPAPWFARHAGHADIVREQLDGALAGQLTLAANDMPRNDFI